VTGTLTKSLTWSDLSSPSSLFLPLFLHSAMIVNSVKQDPLNINVSTSPPPLTSRPLDLLYVIYFLVCNLTPKPHLTHPTLKQTHIPATLLIDFQSLYPSSLTPLAIRRLPELYIQLSNDPLVGGLLGYFGDSEHLLWFKSFLLLEVYAIQAQYDYFNAVLIRYIHCQGISIPSIPPRDPRSVERYLLFCSTDTTPSC
jgi:hypothetical protein